MERRSIRTKLVLCLAILATAGGAVSAAQTVQGTVVSSCSASVTITIDGGSAPMIIKPARGAAIMRGQLGLEMRKATLCDMAPGDRVVAIVKADGTAESIKSFYSVAKGTLAGKAGDKLFMSDGSTIRTNANTRVVLSSGKVGRPSDLTAGSSLICRLSPRSKEACMIVASKPAPKPATPALAKKTTEVKAAPVRIAMNSVPTAPAKTDARVKGYAEIAGAPVPPGSKSGVASVTVLPQLPSSVTEPAVLPIIESVTYTPSENPKAKDWIRVDVSGKPGGRAVCEVKGLIPRTVMKEMAPGKYRASVMVPGGKLVRNEPLLAHLSISGVDAPVVQAGKLFTVEAPALEPAAPPQPVVAHAPEPAPAPASAVAPKPAPEPAPAVEPAKPEPPKEKAPVIVTSPVLGTRILRTLLVTGTAEPGSNVMVSVTYSNGLTGLLNISGQVSSQLVAADESGQFRMGPLPLEGPLATRGLIFTVKACYPDSEQAASMVSVFGDRS